MKTTEKLLNELIETKTLKSWCNFFQWQGGTIHQVKKELKKMIGVRTSLLLMDTKHDILCKGCKDCI